MNGSPMNENQCGKALAFDDFVRSFPLEPGAEERRRKLNRGDLCRPDLIEIRGEVYEQTEFTEMLADAEDQAEFEAWDDEEDDEP